MYYDDKKITTYEGIDDIKLGDTFENIVTILKEHKIIFSTGIDKNKGCTQQIEWKTIYIKKYMSLVFANNILFQINFEEEFKGALDNGIKIGTLISVAQKMDTNLEYDDWNEVWQSNVGYWLFDTVEFKKVYTITIGIKEMLSDDEFYSYKWLSKYEKIKQKQI